MAKRIIGIVLVIAALGTALLGIKVGGAAPAHKQIIESAAVVSDGRVLPENEGKFVIVTGMLDATLPFLDKETGILLNSIAAFRHVEKLSIQQGDEEKPDTWKWEFTGLEQDLGGSRKLTAPNVTFGEFRVSDELMQAVNAHDKLADYSYMDLSALGFDTFKEDGIIYLYADGIMPGDGDEVKNTDLFGRTDYDYRDQVGTLRVYYDVMADSTMEYTIIGLQTNGTLEDIDELDMANVLAGHLTVPQLLEYADSSAANARTGAWVTAAILALLGIVLIIKSGKPAQEKKSKEK